MKLSEAERDTLRVAAKGDGSFHTTVKEWALNVCDPMMEQGFLSHRRTYVDGFKRPVWAYEATPAGLKALEEE